MLTTANHSPFTQSPFGGMAGGAPMLLPNQLPDFEIFFDMRKSLTQGEDGKVWIEGIASDQSTDLDGEMVKAIAYPPAIEYLNKFGKFNWDHHNNIIGDITEAHFITPQEAKERYGVMVKGTSVWIRGWVMPLESDPTDKDLRDFHKFFKSGAKLGFSMQGIYADQRVMKNEQGEDVVVSVPGFVHQVAVCPQPKCGNAAMFRKSLSALMVKSVNDAPAPPVEENSWPVVMCSGEIFEKSQAVNQNASNDGPATTNAHEIAPIHAHLSKMLKYAGSSHDTEGASGIIGDKHDPSKGVVHHDYHVPNADAGRDWAQHLYLGNAPIKHGLAPIASTQNGDLSHVKMAARDGQIHSFTFIAPGLKAGFHKDSPIHSRATHCLTEKGYEPISSVQKGLSTTGVPAQLNPVGGDALKISELSGDGEGKKKKCACKCGCCCCSDNGEEELRELRKSVHLMLDTAQAAMEE